MDEKKKRGRPKKIIEAPSPDDDKIQKKRGRKKKVDITYQMPLTIKTNKENTNYIVMLDIKYSDLDTTVNDLNRSKSIVCDDIVESFSQLIQQRRNLYDNSTQLKTIHQAIFSPENAKVDFFSVYNQKETNITILPIFQLNGDIWPTYSPYSCWNCDCQFNTPPIGIPESVNNGQYYCSGNFCSYACAGRYIIDNDHNITRFDKLSFLNTLYQTTYDLDIDQFVKIANPKQTLHKYGGCLSYSQYHDEEISQKIEVYKLPIIPLYHYICNDISNDVTIDDTLTKENITLIGDISNN